MASRDIAIACHAVDSQGALVVDGTTLYSTGLAGGTAPRALVRWRSSEAEIGGRPVRMEGRSELADDMDSGSAWRVTQVRITAVAPRRTGTPPPIGTEAPLRVGHAPQPAGERRQQVPSIEIKRQ